MVQINVREDGSEIVRYDYEDYQAYVRQGDLSSFPNYAANSHWHEDLEFIYVLDGKMLYNVNGGIFELRPGDALIVNSRRFHYGFSTDNADCHYLCLLLHPMLLCASQQVEQTFVDPFLSDNAPPCFLLHGDFPWEAEVIEGIQSIYACREEDAAPLRIQRAFYQIWLALYENLLKDSVRKKKPAKRDQKLALLKDMVAYIKQNYREKLTLEDIARVGYLSKNGCLALFRRYMHETPINYLLGYRLKVGAELLIGTKGSVTEIAYQVGFSGASYFTECFHRVYGCTPLEYRRAHGGTEDHGSMER